MNATKYRLTKRAHGWVVQEQINMAVSTAPVWLGWRTLSTHRWHFTASLKLWWLRERARRKTEANKLP